MRAEHSSRPLGRRSPAARHTSATFPDGRVRGTVPGRMGRTRIATNGGAISRSRIAATCMLCVLVLASCVTAHAQTPEFRHGLGLRVGYGWDLERLVYSPLRAGMGVTYDYRAPRFPLYVAAEGTYFVGHHWDSRLPDALRLHVMQASVTLGYRRNVTPAIALSAGAGIGVETLRVRPSEGGVRATGLDTDLMVVLEMGSRFELGRRVFVDVLGRFTLSRHDRHWDPNEPSFASVQAMSTLGVHLGESIPRDSDVAATDRPDEAVVPEVHQRDDHRRGPDDLGVGPLDEEAVPERRAEEEQH